ncbi:MAG TPA: heavy metal translocating P-type ATPase [Candidatus Obscuribacterales bacterium]
MSAFRISDVPSGMNESVPSDDSPGHSSVRGCDEEQIASAPHNKRIKPEQTIAFEIAHSIPGRLRLKIRGLRKNFRQIAASLDSLADLNGVRSIRCNGWCNAAVVTYDPRLLDEAQIVEYIDKLGATHGVAPTQETNDAVTVSKTRTVAFSLPVRWLRQAILFIESIIPCGLQVAIGAAAFVAPWLQVPALVSTVLLIASSTPIYCRALRTFIDERKFGIDALDGTAAGLMIAHGNFAEAGFMTALIALGELIRAKTSQRCEKLVSDLLGMSGRSAWLVKGKKRVCVPADEVKVGDTVVVYPGDMIPVDGTIIDGEAAVDQATLTGESMPVELADGATVYASTVVVEGKIYVRCEATGSQTKAGLVLSTIESAPIHETNIQNYASSVADRAVMPIFLAATACFLVTRDINRLMSMLILDFCTGIRIAAPTAILSSMTRAGRRGILVKSGAALERLSTVSAIVFDKTGTLTSGEPVVEEVSRFNGRTEDEVLALAAAVEMRLHHPAARAIVKAAQQKGLSIPERGESEFMRSMGVKAMVDGHEVIVGSKTMMTSAGIKIDETRERELHARKLGESLSFVAVDGQVAGLIRYSDRLRPEVAKAIADLKKLGVKKLVMATGDSEEAAERIAACCGITDVIARAFPEDKAALVKKLKDEGHTVAVIGDGINDSPALAYADIAISLHGATDAARHSADVVLTDDDLSRLPEAVSIARAAMSLVKQNLIVAVAPNAGGIAAAAVGMLGPAGATLLNNGSAIGAALNSLRPLYTP